MTSLLHIVASPRGDSYSRQAATALLDAWRAAHPAGTIETLDLWQAKLPPFDGDTLAAKYAVLGGRDFTPAQQAAWGAVTATAEHFKAFDRHVISTPMWNFGVPYRLKHYLDVIAQPGLTFGWSAERGYYGLVTGRRARIVMASMGEYGPGSGAESLDHAAPYLEWMLKFFGFDDVRTLRVGSTGGDAAHTAQVREQALAAARAAAASF